MQIETSNSWKGKGFAAAIRGETPLENRLCFAQATNRYAWPDSFRMGRLGSMKLIQNVRDSSIQIFDLESDPLERYDLSRTNDQPIRELKRAFEEWITKHEEISSPNADDADSEMIELFKSMGYIE